MRSQYIAITAMRYREGEPLTFYRQTFGNTEGMSSPEIKAAAEEQVRRSAMEEEWAETGETMVMRVTTMATQIQMF